MKLPSILGGAGEKLTDCDQLAQRGMRICLQGHQSFATAVRAVHETLWATRGCTPPEKIETTASNELMKRFTRNNDYARWMKDWL